jgi:hypothetical protein
MENGGGVAETADMKRIQPVDNFVRNSVIVLSFDNGMKIASTVLVSVFRKNY